MLGFMLLLVEATVQVVRIETALIRAVVLPTFRLLTKAFLQQISRGDFSRSIAAHRDRTSLQGDPWNSAHCGCTAGDPHGQAAQQRNRVLASLVHIGSDSRLPLGGLCFCGICPSQPCHRLCQSSMDVLAGACDFQW